MDVETKKKECFSSTAILQLFWTLNPDLSILVVPAAAVPAASLSAQEAGTSPGSVLAWMGHKQLLQTPLQISQTVCFWFWVPSLRRPKIIGLVSLVIVGCEIFCFTRFLWIVAVH